LAVPDVECAPVRQACALGGALDDLFDFLAACPRLSEFAKLVCSGTHHALPSILGAFPTPACADTGHGNAPTEMAKPTVKTRAGNAPAIHSITVPRSERAAAALRELVAVAAEKLAAVYRCPQPIVDA